MDCFFPNSIFDSVGLFYQIFYSSCSSSQSGSSNNSSNNISRRAAAAAAEAAAAAAAAAVAVAVAVAVVVAVVVVVVVAQPQYNYVDNKSNYDRRKDVIRKTAVASGFTITQFRKPRGNNDDRHILISLTTSIY